MSIKCIYSLYNGCLSINTLIIEQTLFEDSFATLGGGFYITAVKQLVININSSQIRSTNSDRQGGFLYILVLSGTFSLQINNCTINDVSSRYEGGVVYISAQSQINNVSFNNLDIQDSYSIQGSFLSINFNSANSKNSLTIMRNITIKQSEEKYRNFLSQFHNFTKVDVAKYKQYNLLISVLNGSIILQDCNFYNIYAQGVLIAQGCQNIQLIRVQISGAKILNTQILNLMFENLMMNEIVIQNISQIELNKELEFKECQLQPESEQALQCPIDGAAHTLSYIRPNHQFNNNYTNCNMNKIMSVGRGELRFIQLVPTTTTSTKILISNILLSNVYCESCVTGGFSFQGINFDQKLNISYFYSSMNNCGFYGCLLLANGNITTISETQLNITPQSLITNPITVNNVKLVNGQAKFGVGVFGYNVSVILQDAQFINNTASSKGGAIYFNGLGLKSILLQKSNINDNKASEGGGLYLANQILQQTAKWDVDISHNYASNFAGQVAEYPKSLTITVDSNRTLLNKILVSQTESEIIEEIYVNPYKILGQQNMVPYIRFPTGQSISQYNYFDINKWQAIPYNISFRVIPLNLHLNPIKQLTNSTCRISARRMSTQNTQTPFTTNFTSYSTVFFNDTSSDYNLDNLVILFGSFEDLLQLQISCDSVKIPVYNQVKPYQVLYLITNYQLRVNVQIFQCQVGEYYDAIVGCVKCDSKQDKYQVQVGAFACSFKDSQTMESITETMLNVKESYWRPYSHNPKIEQCYNYIYNCLGGWTPGDSSCAIGHIGALCEQCDLYDIRSGGSYSRSSSYKCGSCDQTTANSISVTLISLWTLLSILMTVKSTKQLVDEIILRNKLNAIRIFANANKQSSAVLIKVLTNYLQIISTISTFRFEVPPGLEQIVNNAGNPISSMMYSLDCFLINISSIEIQYFRSIWGILLSLFYMTIFLLAYNITIIIGRAKYNICIISTTIIYMYIFIQPNLVGGLISLLSSRNISDILWIQGNVAYQFDTSQHKLWMLGFALPMFLILSVIIPYILWYGVHQNKNKLNSIKSRQVWGYLYNEYKYVAYFWENVKIIQKELIIIVLSYYEDQIPIKAALCFSFIFSYNILSHSYKPYMTGELNRLDIESTSICIISIVLGSTIYIAQTNQLQEIIWPFYLILGVLNVYFITKMVLLILLSYLKEFEVQLDFVRNKINAKWPHLEQTFLGKFLKNQSQRRKLIRQRFLQIKPQLMNQARKIVQIKRYLSSFNSSGVTVINDTFRLQLHQFQQIPQNQSILQKEKLIQQIDIIKEEVKCSRMHSKQDDNNV